MNLETCYQQLDGDYADVMSRLIREQTVQRFIFKFLEDKSKDELCLAMEAGDFETAFRAAHTVKGICQNLSFTRLYHSSYQLTEALRREQYQEAASLMPAFSFDYSQTVDAIRAYKNTLEDYSR
mgnify:CR=1 FL=1